MGRTKTLDEIKAEVRAMTGKSKIFRAQDWPMSNLFWPSSPAKIPIYRPQSGCGWRSPMKKPVKAHEQAGRINQAREAYIQACTYYAAGRYPVPHCSGKLQSFRKSLELYENAGRYFDPPLKRTEIAMTIKSPRRFLR